MYFHTKIMSLSHFYFCFWHRHQRAKAASGVDMAMARVDGNCQSGRSSKSKRHVDSGAEGKHPSPRSPTATGFPTRTTKTNNNSILGKKNGTELKQLATTALAKVEDLKRCEKATCAYAHSAFHQEQQQQQKQQQEQQKNEQEQNQPKMDSPAIKKC